MERTIKKAALEFLEEKMVLLSGPRQAGKTYFSKMIMKKFKYLNFDHVDHRNEILKQTWSRETDLLIFDEVHKMKKWKQWLKGIYDVEGNRPPILVTGSAKMNTFRKSGDSLAGRFYPLQLFPLSVAEVDRKHGRQVVESLLKTGPFPEPFLKGTERSAALWRNSHLDIILRQDLLDLEKVREIKSIEILVSLLAERVGGGISYANLAGDLGVHPLTVKKWIEILEDLYVVFIVKPYTVKLTKAIKKEPKIYFYDYARVPEGPQRLENLVALHFFKEAAFLSETEGEKIELRYYRDKEKREVDFVITKNRIATKFLEVKSSDDNLSSSLNYLHHKHNFKCESLQLVYNLKSEKNFNGILVKDLSKYLTTLKT